MPILTMEQTILTWIHLISASIWVGGSLFIGFILSPILRSSSISSDQRFQIMVNIGKRFNKIALPALILLILTGIYKSQNILFDIDLFSINYGSILFIKIIFVSSLIVSFFIHVHIINVSLKTKIQNDKQIQKIRKKVILNGQFMLFMSLIIIFMASLLDSGI